MDWLSRRIYFRHRVEHPREMRKRLTRRREGAHEHAAHPGARASTRGIFPSLWERLFGERDAVAGQLHTLARQGTWMARPGHACAFAMIVLFNLGSLVSIAGEPTHIFLAAWQRGQLDLNAGIAAGISAFLVLCMDMASLNAAHKLRVHAARRAPWHAPGTRYHHSGRRRL